MSAGVKRVSHLAVPHISIEVTDHPDTGLAKAVEPQDFTVSAELARAVARAEVSDAVAAAMADLGLSLRAFQRQSGIDPATISRLINGRNSQGCTVATLAQIALGMGKTLKITIE
jgi:hypothetical protein